MSCYVRLPRPNDVITFIVPLTPGHAVDVPGALRRFGDRYICDEFAHPKVTNLRKMYHTKLMELSATEGANLFSMLCLFFYVF